MDNRKDSNWTRIREAQRLISVAARHFAPYPRLYFYRLDMLPGLPLYSSATTRAARHLVLSTFQPSPAFWKLERGECGNLHLHVISPLPPIAVKGWATCGTVYDLPGLLAYLSKPADARLCRPGKLTAWTPDPYTRARNRYRAEDELGEARRLKRAAGGRRLSPLSGWVNTRRDRPASPSLLLVLDVLRLLWVMSQEAPLKVAPLPAPPSTAQRPLPGLPVRPWGHISTHPPPRIGQVQAR